MRFNDSKILAQKYEKLFENVGTGDLSYADKLNNIYVLIRDKIKTFDNPVKDIIGGLIQMGFKYADLNWRKAFLMAAQSLKGQGIDLTFNVDDILDYFYDKEVPASEVDPQSFPSEEAEMDLEDEEVWDDDECNAHHYNETEKFQNHKLEYEVEDAEDMDIISVEPGMEMEIEEVPNKSDINEVLYTELDQARDHIELIINKITQDDDELEDWMKAKLTKASDYIIDVWQRLKSKDDLNSSCGCDEF